MLAAEAFAMRVLPCHPLLLMLLLLLATVAAEQLPAEQVSALLDIQRLLEYPSAMADWNVNTDFCSSKQGGATVLACAGGTLTELQVVGDKAWVATAELRASLNQNPSKDGNLTMSLSSSFSMVELADSLTVLQGLRTLALTSAGIWGQLEDLGRLNRLQSLEVLTFSSNLINGSVPSRWGRLANLQALDLSHNALSGSIPDLSSTPLNGSLLTLSLSDNLFSGSIPDTFSGLPNLRNLFLDSNQLSGSFPGALASMPSLESLALGGNGWRGPVPSLHRLANLRILDLSFSALGPDFPLLLPPSLASLVLAGNAFADALPSSLLTPEAFPALATLDLSFNSFSGSLQASLFSLPALASLLLQNNHLSGALPRDLSLGPKLATLDISYNFFVGALPPALQHPDASRTLSFSFNCFDANVSDSGLFASSQLQNAPAFCEQEVASEFGAMRAAGRGGKDHVALIAGVAGGAVGLVAALLVLVVLCTRKFLDGGLSGRTRRAGADSTSVEQSSTTGSLSLVVAGGSGAGSDKGVPSDFLSKARFISLSSKLGVLSFSDNRVYSLEQLERATNGFHRANLLGVGKRGKVYRGRLDDGTPVAVKCVPLDPHSDVPDLRVRLSGLAKLRHHNLVSLLGYCVESESEAGRRRLLLVSELVGNGTLRSHLTRGKGGEEPLSWAERLHAVVGAGRGLQYLHSGPGLLSRGGGVKHGIKIHNVLLDQHLVAKLSDFGLPLPGSGEMDAAAALARRTGGHLNLDLYRQQQQQRQRADKLDVYNFGLILLEIVLGRPPLIENPTADSPNIPELNMLMLDEQGPTMDLIDFAIAGSYVPESLATVLDIASKCLSEDPSARPSMEDALWNLQYAAQVQDCSGSAGSGLDPLDSSDLIELQNFRKSKSRGFGAAAASSASTDTELQRG